MKRVIVVFGVGVTPSGISGIGESLVRTARDLCAIQKTDLVVFSGKEQRRGKSEAFLMEEYAKAISIKVPTAIEERETSLWKRAHSVVALLQKRFHRRSFLITFVSHPLEMRRIMAAFEAVGLIVRDKASFVASPYPIREEYDELLSKKQFHSAEMMQQHEERSYFLYRLFSFPHPRFSFFRILSSLRIHI